MSKKQKQKVWFKKEKVFSLAQFEKYLKQYYKEVDQLEKQLKKLNSHLSPSQKLNVKNMFWNAKGQVYYEAFLWHRVFLFFKKKNLINISDLIEYIEPEFFDIWFQYANQNPNPNTWLLWDSEVKIDNFCFYKKVHELVEKKITSINFHNLMWVGMRVGNLGDDWENYQNLICEWLESFRSLIKTPTQ